MNFLLAIGLLRCPEEQRLVLWTMGHLGDLNKLSNIMGIRLIGRYRRKLEVGVYLILLWSALTQNENHRPSIYEVYEALLEMGRQRPKEYLKKLC